MVSKPRHYFIAEKDADGKNRFPDEDANGLREDAVDETGGPEGRGSWTDSITTTAVKCSSSCWKVTFVSTTLRSKGFRL